MYDEMMRRHYAKRTIETYLHWIKTTHSTPTND
jgi:hypothetical protein